MLNLQKHMQCKSQWRFYLPSFGVFEREVRRFFNVPAQTIFAPLGSALIYFYLFGVILGGLFQHNNFNYGYSYLIFLIPGLIAMETLNSSFQNPVSSILIAKWNGSLIDVLMSPVSTFGLWLAYAGGALIRSSLVILSVLIAGCIVAGHIPHINFALLFCSLVITVGIFASLGVVVGSIVKNFEQVSIVTLFILQPLSFFSGVFFSFQSLPSWIQHIRYYNPVFYIVSMFRLSILGRADTDMITAFCISLTFFILILILSLKFLSTGFGLRN